MKRKDYCMKIWSVYIIGVADRVRALLVYPESTREARRNRRKFDEA